MKNFVKGSLIALIAIVPLTNVAYATFPDVSSDHLHYDAINYLQEEGTVDGFTDGTYRAENEITRAEFTKIIINTIFENSNTEESEVRDYILSDRDLGCFDGPDDGGITFHSSFSDVESYTEAHYFAGENHPASGNIFAEYLCMAKIQGIVNGYTDGTFRPENPITVGEASKIISNAYEFTDLDGGPEGEVFRPFIEELIERNALPAIMSADVMGYPGTMAISDLDDTLTRGGMAEIIYRIQRNITNKDSFEYYEELVLVSVDRLVYRGDASVLNLPGFEEGYIYFEDPDYCATETCSVVYLLNSDDAEYYLVGEADGREYSLNSGHILQVASGELDAFELIDDNHSLEPLFDL